MKLNLGLINLASTLASYASSRHAILSENVANADTPGYRARDLQSFDQVMGPKTDVRPFTARATRPEHIGFNAQNAAFQPREVAAFGSEQPNGNTVTLEDQMVRSAEVKQQHDLALGVYMKSLSILRLGMGRRS